MLRGAGNVQGKGVGAAEGIRRKRLKTHVRRARAQREQPQRQQRPGEGGGCDALDRMRLPLPAIAQLAVREPVGFAAGAAAGVLGLELEQEQLKRWIEQVAATGGIEFDQRGAGSDAAPRQ